MGTPEQPASETKAGDPLRPEEQVSQLEYLRLLDERDTALEQKAALLAALERMMVGLTKESAPDCDWYESIEWDAVDEARSLIAKTGG